MFEKLDEPKILIGDDSEILNNMLRDVFEEHGFAVFQAFDGYECKTAYLKEEPDVTLVDIRMPEKDGLDVLRFIKKKSSDAIVVMMTGAGSEATALQAMKLGADEYLNKPFETGDVLKVVNQLLEDREADKENVRLRKKIRQGERYLAHLTKIINEAIITTDGDGKILFANHAVVNMWGYGEDELKGADIHLLVRGESDALLRRDLVKETIRLGKLEGEFIFRRKDRATFPGYLSTSLIKEGKKITGMVAVVADLTRLHEVERQLKQSEKLASLGKVVEGVAHEVRNCLTSLGGFAARLRKLTAGDEQGSTYTRIILEDVARLESMVKQIEDYVRFAKRYSFTFRKIDMREVAEKAHRRVLSHFPGSVGNRVAFSLSAERNLPRVSADEAAMEEALYNVILNSYEAMPDGGKLTIGLTSSKDFMRIAVTDTGVGIPPEVKVEVFNPFVTSKTSGAGMGLSKVYLLVEEHGGTVEVESEVKKGTTIGIYLPLEQAVTGVLSGRSSHSADRDP